MYNMFMCDIIKNEVLMIILKPLQIKSLITIQKKQLAEKLKEITNEKKIQSGEYFENRKRFEKQYGNWKWQKIKNKLFFYHDEIKIELLEVPIFVLSKFKDYLINL
jgi:hypothetical protein